MVGNGIIVSLYYCQRGDIKLEHRGQEGRNQQRRRFWKRWKRVRERSHDTISSSEAGWQLLIQSWFFSKAWAFSMVLIFTKLKPVWSLRSQIVAVFDNFSHSKTNSQQHKSLYNVVQGFAEELNRCLTKTEEQTVIYERASSIAWPTTESQICNEFIVTHCLAKPSLWTVWNKRKEP